MKNIDCNSNVAETGGCIYSAFSMIHILNSLFQNNTASNDGGALYIYSSLPSSSSYISIDSTIFYENSAQNGNGGAIYHDDVTELVLSFVLIEKNSAIHGGGIYSSWELEVEDSIISENVAKKDGGGIYCKGLSFLFLENLFSNNTAFERGGGLFSFVLSGTMEETQFIQNRAKFGGAVTYVLYFI